MSSVTTGPQLVVNNLEYVEEATYGVMPTNPTMVYAAETAVIRIGKDQNLKEFRRLGSEDPFKLLQGKKDVKLSIEFAISNTTFVKYGIMANSGTGTINKSLSFGFSYPINGTTNYRTILGARIQQLKIVGSDQTPELRVTCDVDIADITTPSTTDYKGTGAHGTPGTAAPYTFYGAGAGPITWGGIALDCTQFTAVWNRDIKSKTPLGGRTKKYQRSGNRQQMGDFIAPTVGTSLETDSEAGTARTLVWTIAPAISITWTNAELSNLSDESFDIDQGDDLMSSWAFVATSSIIT